ncbi:putative quinol monooxygenase [uncultured Gilliamella sp.]|uniref:putative quinol monooxygenase n=1 Tax=uncultured Gilliamella sp. TaxID=1193505 RepID=UPI0025F0BC37|nr:putative quinol monooxygenase [uncultured Gilliamella sp.]
MSELSIIAIHHVKPAFVEAYRQAAEQIIALSRKESGCVAYDLGIDLSDSNMFIFTETWASRQALEHHQNTAHFLAFKTFLNDKLVGRECYITKKFN